MVIELKIDAAAHDAANIDQVWDDALDLNNVHEARHRLTIVTASCGLSA